MLPVQIATRLASFKCQSRVLGPWCHLGSPARSESTIQSTPPPRSASRDPRRAITRTALHRRTVLGYGFPELVSQQRVAGAHAHHSAKRRRHHILVLLALRHVQCNVRLHHLRVLWPHPPVISEVVSTSPPAWPSSPPFISSTTRSMKRERRNWEQHSAGGTLRTGRYVCLPHRVD